MEQAVGNSWYVVLSFEIISSREITDKEKLLLALISNLQNQKGYCYAGNAYLSETLNCTMNYVTEMITRLVKLGWLFREVKKGPTLGVLERILVVNLKKTVKTTPPLNPMTPPPLNPKTLPHSSSDIITNLIEDKEEVKVPQFILPALPELEEIKKFSAGAKNSAIWYESTCIAMSLKKEALFEWMDLFDVHISNTNEVRGIDARKYRSLLMGWIRSQNAQGKTLQSYKSTQLNNNVRTASNQQQYGSYQSKNGKNAQSHTGRTIIHDKP